jgi:Tol biopolymer transport system component/DNA-binding winged helix-turn-helix (wHTH) protein
MSVVRTPPQLNRLFRFGDFEFSVRAGELRKNGEIVRLQNQPLRVLLVLLDYAGEAVTRDEIRERAWPDDSVQDFDNSLRVAIAKLRQAFADDVETPRYIETLPRRGYRWLYPVTVHDTQPSFVDSEFSGNPPPVGITNPRMPPRADLPQSLSPEPSRRTILVRRLVLSLTLWAAVMAAAWFMRPRPPVSDPKVVPLTTYAGLEYMPALSPDGNSVAFGWTGANPGDPYGVYVKQVGQDLARRVTDTPSGASDSDPVWAPDGRSVYFYRRGGAPISGIYVAPAQGGPARRLVAITLTGRRVRRGRFDVSPHGDTLIYPDAVAEHKTIALFTLDLAAMKSHQLTFPPPDSEGDGDPAFSHDGRSVAFQRDVADLQQVFVVPTAGGDARELTSENRIDIDGLAWTVDDDHILLGGQQLRTIPFTKDAQTPTVVPYLPGPVLFPSLRGNRLAYTQAWDNANIWKLNLRRPSQSSGDQPVNLISSTRQQAAASFSPDGSQIAFQSDRSGAWEIWKSNRDGSNPVQMTQYGGPLTGTPRWSPDGKQIAFDSRANGRSDIYVINAEGGTPRQITNNPAVEAVPAWSRDGKWVYYSSNRDGVMNIWKMPVAGGAEKQLTTRGGIYAAESYDGEYLYFSRSQTDPAVWRVPVRGGVEEPVSDAPTPFDCTHWAMGPSGLYIADRDGNLHFYDFASRRTVQIIHHPEFLTDWSLAVSPDGREVIWAQIDARSADLMLVENFR